MKWFRSKAIQDRIEVKHASFLYGMGAARWLERRFDTLATEGYEKNPIVYSCVTKLARAAASVDLKLYRQKGGKLTEIAEHDLLKLLDHPNPTMGGKKFMETMATQYLVGGNAYLHGIGIDPLRRKPEPPKELWLMPPQSMEPKRQDRSFLPAYFEYKQAKGDPIRFPVEQITGKSAILHLKTVNLMNPLIGLPPMVAAAYGVDVFNSGQAWNKALLDNEARPSGAIEFLDGDGKPAFLTDTQRQEIDAMINQRFTGKQNAGRPLILHGGMKWVPMSLNPKDMDHRENMLTNARFIAGVYHTPPQLVNIPGESTYSNYAEAKLAYWSDTVLPFLGSVLEDVNNWLTPLYGEDLYLWYDPEMIPALEPLRKVMFERLSAATFLTPNEKRKAAGFDTVEGGDELLVPATSIPLSLAGVVDLPEPGSEADPAKPDPEADSDAE